MFNELNTFFANRISLLTVISRERKKRESVLKYKDNYNGLLDHT